MATLYWRNTGGGNWGTANNWSTTSGGAGGVVVPTAADDVVFDGNSGANGTTITINVAAACHSFDSTAANALNFRCSGTRTLTLGGGSTTTTAAALTLASGQSWDMSGGTFTLSIDNRGGGTTITSNGVALNGMSSNVLAQSNASQTTTTIADDTSFGATTTQIFRGGLTVTSTKTLTVSGNFTYSGSAGTTVLTWTGATISIGGAYNKTGAGTLTLTGNSSSILNIVAGSSASMTMGAASFPGTVNITGNQIPTILDANTFVNFNRTGTTGKGDGLQLGANQTVSGVLTLSGNATSSRLFLFSTVIGAQRTITCNGSFGTIQNLDFQDIAIAGTAGTMTGTSLANGGNTSGITFTGTKTSYWVGGTGNYSDGATHWASSSGGTAGAANYPLLHDTAIFDNNSFSADGQAVSSDVLCYAALDMSAVSNFTFSFGGVAGTSNFFGNIALTNKCTFQGNTLNAWAMMKRSTTQTFTQNGATFGGSGSEIVQVKNFGNTFQPQDDQVWSVTAAMQFVNGTFNPLGNLQTVGMAESGSAVRAFTGTSGKTLTLTGAGNIFVLTSVNGTVTPNGMNLTITNTAASTKTISHPTDGEQWGDLNVATGASAGPVVFSDGLNFNTMNATGGSTVTINLRGGKTYTLTQPVFFTGAPGNLITIITHSAGTAATLSCSSTVVTDYISLKDNTASGATPFYAGANSTNVSGNTNWNFTARPSGGTMLMMGM